MTNCTQEKKLNTVVRKHKCTNCMACYNICPTDAIEIIEDNEGFAYPSINEEKCTHCGLCTKKCPALNLDQVKEISKHNTKPAIYGGYIKDEEVRAKSSSGGVFSALAKYVLKKNGYVCGARFTKGGICEHVIVDNAKDLAPLRGSKYVQSNINNCYKEIKTLLEQDKYILFTGTPCQVAGLYSVLGKDYENLITVDILCHGVPSQKLFIEYLDELTSGHTNTITEINFKSKKTGWRTPTLIIKGTDFYKEINDVYEQDTYMKGFLNNLTIRKSCTDCQYNRLPRQGDFTIGDFWGIENYDSALDDNSGCSIILCNSKKSMDILNKIEPEFENLKKVDVPNLNDYNMVSKKSYNHPYRGYFFEKYAANEYTTLTNLITETLKKRDGIAIHNFAHSKCNYGSVLTGCALQKLIKKRGYTPVNFIVLDNEICPDLSNLDDFQKENIDFTYPCKTDEQLKNLNHMFQTFIIGSDTVFLDFEIGQDYFNNMKFQFADFSKNICSFAASFGKNKLEKWRSGPNSRYSLEELADAKRLMKRFNHVSVRETSGVQICKDNFGIEAECIMDPVFFLSKEDWKKLFTKETSSIKHDTKYILYLKQIDKDVLEYIDKIENIDILYDGDDYKTTLSDVTKANLKGPKIEDWLQSIAECEVLYTDSFHGMCFAIIFNKQFVLFDTSGDLFERCSSLMNLLGIKSRLAHTIEDIKRLNNNPIDYNVVNKKLAEQMAISEKFLDKILYSHNNFDKIRNYMEALELKIEKEISKFKDKKPENAPPRKEKWDFLGIQVFKKSKEKNNLWFYLFGIPLIKEEQKGQNTYYKLFGCIRLLKKSVRY